MTEAVAFLWLWGVLIVVACGVLVGVLFMAGVLYVSGREADAEERRHPEDDNWRY